MNILIIKLGALGDVVMATPLITAIQSAHRRAEFHLLTTPAFAPVFLAWPNLHVHAYPRSGWGAMWSMLRFIRGGRFERIYDLQGNDRTGLLCALSGVREKVGNHARYPYTHHPAGRWHGQCHIFERMKQVLASAGVEVELDVPVLPATDDERADVDTWLGDAGLDQKPFCILHAGASAARPEKCWPRYAALAARCAEHGVTPVWIGGEQERDQNAALQNASGGVDATGRFSIPALAYFGQRAAFAVTNDSGPMHILSASGIPVFGLFGPSDWRRNHALGQDKRVITPPAGETAIDGIKVDDVFDRLFISGYLEA